MKCTCLLILIIIMNSTNYTNQENSFKMEYPDNDFSADITDYTDYSPSGLINNYDNNFQDFSNYKTVSISTEYQVSKPTSIMITPLQNQIDYYNYREPTLPYDSYSTNRSNNNESFITSNSNLIIISKDCSKECLECSNGNCKKCIRGKFVFNGICYDNCPQGLFADNLDMTCKEEKDNPVYIKAYSISRCVNSCGKNFFDCSCNSSCVINGTCCSDYRFCQVIQENHIKNTKIPNCLFADEDDSICLQCKENFYYFNNQCLLKCPELKINLRYLNTKYLFNKDNEINKVKGKYPNVIIPYQENKICKEIRLECNMDDSIENYHCERCENQKCLKCKNGFYLFENKCLKSCPVSMRANRIDFTCETKSSFSFYWIFPSNFSCKDNCGVNSLESDCSCRHSCLRRGNCCDDFEKECKAEIAREVCKLCDDCVSGVCLKCKENSFSNGFRKNECDCQSGFYYDIQEDICLPNKLNEVKEIMIDKEQQNHEKNLIVVANDSKQEEKKIKPNITYKPVIYQNKTSYSFDDDVYSNFNQNSTNTSKKEFAYAEEVKVGVDHIECDKHNKDEKLLKILFSNYDNSNNITKSCENTNKNISIDNNNSNNNNTQHFFNQNFEKKPIRNKNIVDPVININLDDNKTDGTLDIATIVNEFDTHKKEKNLKDDLGIVNIFKNNSFKADFKNKKTEKSIINSNNDDINDIINKSLSEDLLNSFKKLFSNFALDKQKSKQTLNLYLNGNISINFLTGNTNPQIIYKNIYNKDSYNTNKTILYNIQSNSKPNDTDKSKSSELNSESFIRKTNPSDTKLRNSNQNTEILEPDIGKKQKIKDGLSKLNIKTIKTPHKEKNNDHNSYENNANHDINEKDDNIVSKDYKSNFEKKQSSKYSEEKIMKGFELTEDKIEKLLEDKELKSFLKKKIELLNKMKKNSYNLNNGDHSKNYEEGELLGFSNPKVNKTLEKETNYGNLRNGMKRENSDAPKEIMNFYKKKN